MGRHLDKEPAFVENKPGPFATEYAAYITGQTINVDGGLIMS